MYTIPPISTARAKPCNVLMLLKKIISTLPINNVENITLNIN